MPALARRQTMSFGQEAVVLAAAALLSIPMSFLKFCAPDAISYSDKRSALLVLTPSLPVCQNNNLVARNKYSHSYIRKCQKLSVVFPLVLLLHLQFRHPYYNHMKYTQINKWQRK